MKVFMFFVLCIISADYGIAQYTRCVNPNQRPGLCVHINECQILYSVLQQPNLSQSVKDFIKDSGCGKGLDNRPFVCCTRDTSYTRSRRLTPTFRDYEDFVENGGNSNSFDYSWDAQPSPSPPQRNRFQFPQQNFAPWNSNNDDRTTVRPFGNGADGGNLLPQPPSCGGVSIDNKIYGGEDAGLLEFPWVVLMEYRRLAGGGLKSSCAGTLINQRYVLTAAHCVIGRIQREVGPLNSVLLGEHDTRSSVDCAGNVCAPEAQRVGVEETRVHELYKNGAPNQVHDLALVRLERSVRYSDSVRPICLPSVVAPEMRRAGQQYTVVGWGRTLQSKTSPVKQKLVVGYVEPAQCQAKFAERKVSIAPTQLCLGAKYAQDSCDGDSGGPLMRFRDNAWVLEGIVSFGYKCGLKDWPGVYTSVAAYDIWIKQNVRP